MTLIDQQAPGRPKGIPFGNPEEYGPPAPGSPQDPTSLAAQRTQAVQQAAGGGPVLAPAQPPSSPLERARKQYQTTYDSIYGPQGIDAQINQGIAQGLTADDRALQRLYDSRTRAASQLNDDLKAVTAAEEQAKKDAAAAQRRLAAMTRKAQRGEGPTIRAYDPNLTLPQNAQNFSDDMRDARDLDEITSDQADSMEKAWRVAYVDAPMQQRAEAATAAQQKIAERNAATSEMNAATSQFSAYTQASQYDTTNRREAQKFALERGDKAVERGTKAEENRRFAAYQKARAGGASPDAALASAIDAVPYGGKDELDKLANDEVDRTLVALGFPAQGRGAAAVSGPAGTAVAASPPPAAAGAPPPAAAGTTAAPPAGMTPQQLAGGKLGLAQATGTMAPPPTGPPPGMPPTFPQDPTGRFRMPPQY